jgi:hypothetical protein
MSGLQDRASSPPREDSGQAMLNYIPGGLLCTY